MAISKAVTLANFSAGGALIVDSTDKRIGVGTTPAVSLDVLGNVEAVGVITASTGFYGELQTAAQPGITSVGTLASLNVSGNATIGGVLTYDDVTNVDSVGIITARIGIHVGTGTSISSPSSNVLTLGTNGQERLRIDSSGNLGLGENSPLSLLHVKSGDSGASAVESGSFLTVESNGTSAIQMLSGTSHNNYIYFGDSGDTNIGAIQYSHGADAFIIYTNTSERLRINSSGNVGIGTDNPASKLHVEKGGELNVLFEGSASTLGTRLSLKNNNTTANAYNEIEGTDAGGQGTSSIRFVNIDNANNEGSIAFYTRPSGGLTVERLSITSTGVIDGSSNTTAVALPTGTTAQRPSGTSAYIRKNTTNNALEYHNGTNWVEIVTDYFPTGSTTLG